mgnify:CR=1 FL=1
MTTKDFTHELKTERMTDIALSFKKTCALLGAIELELFTHIAGGAGTIEDIDKSMTLGCGHPMGPFALLDFIGLDTTYYIANIMHEEFRDAAFAPPPLLKRMILAGRLGKKSGHGFYKYL